MVATTTIFSGWFFKEMFVGINWDYFWSNSIFILTGNDAIYNAHNVPKWVKLLPIVLAIIGISVATVFYVLIPDLPSKVSKKFKILYILFHNKWFFDEVYNYIFVRPTLLLGQIFWKRGDENIINKFGPDGISKQVMRVTKKIVQLQSGLIYHYAFSMIIGLTFIITFYIIVGRG